MQDRIYMPPEQYRTYKIYLACPEHFIVALYIHFHNCLLAWNKYMEVHDDYCKLCIPILNTCLLIHVIL